MSAAIHEVAERRDDPRALLADLLAHEAHLLPAQAPIARFVHHNTLHAFEDLPFERAVLEAAVALGGEPYLDEARYEEALAGGRIRPEDVDAALEECGDAMSARSRVLRRLRLVPPLPRLAGDAVDWALSEGDHLRRIRPEVDAEARRALLRDATQGEAAMLARLWERCLVLATRRPVSTAAATLDDAARPRTDVRGLSPARRRHVRERDRLLARTGLDADELVHATLIRFLAAYLDQGIAYWPMPCRDGLFRAFKRYYAQPGLTPPWLAGLASELRAAGERDGSAQVLHELALRGISIDACAPFLRATLQALAGWAGMVHQLETRPDLAPGTVPPISLMDFLAVRLVLDRYAARYVAAEVGLELSGLGDEAPTFDPRGDAFTLFAMAQRAGLGPRALEHDEDAEAFAAEVLAFDSIARRRVLHLAYERAFRTRALDAIAIRAKDRVPDPEAPIAQIVCCLDERAESFRRAAEEVEPRFATYGYAGHFDVLMAYEAYGAPRAVPQCPPAITPKHRVREVPFEATDAEEALVRLRAIGHIDHQAQIGSRTLVRGGLVALTGVATAIPLVAQTLFPRLSDRIRAATQRAIAPTARTRLALTRSDGAGPAPDGLYDGFTKAEQAAIVEGLLRAIGLTNGFAQLVLIVGHGSSSVNNPHAAAYNCGACAGGKGGPNARAFAQMANDAEVRALLAQRGLVIPETTYFLGALHDTATDEISLFDEDLCPRTHEQVLANVLASIRRACELDAHERCRRFADAPPRMTPEEALRHAQGRSVDLAQPRPEYCHATNALCIVGRRTLTRGLFLDRRAFLVSYDPTQDDARGTTLERVLAQVGPVGAGINLEYYFSSVDQERYGSGTKLPHNVTALLGVMNGHASDLRTGLHRQTVEIHEPMRLLLVAEATPEVLLGIVERNAVVRRLVTNRWILVASIHPESGAIHFLGREGFVPHELSTSMLPRVPTSRAHYEGRSEHLPFALVGASAEAR